MPLLYRRYAVFMSSGTEIRIPRNSLMLALLALELCNGVIHFTVAIAKAFESRSVQDVCDRCQLAWHVGLPGVGVSIMRLLRQLSDRTRSRSFRLHLNSSAGSCRDCDRCNSSEAIRA